jgi:phosphocarrier protein
MRTWSRSAELVNQRGLHARASAAFAREASKFNAVTVHYDGMSASAASIMDLGCQPASASVEIDAGRG